jgi:hypothetical protein
MLHSHIRIITDTVNSLISATQILVVFFCHCYQYWIRYVYYHKCESFNVRCKIRNVSRAIVTTCGRKRVVSQQLTHLTNISSSLVVCLGPVLVSTKIQYIYTASLQSTICSLFSPLRHTHCVLKGLIWFNAALLWLDSLVTVPCGPKHVVWYCNVNI